MPRSTRIYNTLSHHLIPLKLFVENESANHQVPAGSESHFKVTVIAECFQTLSRVKRHQQVNKLLQDEFQSGLHALSLLLYTPEEWVKKQNNLISSPKCIRQQQ